MSFRFNYDNFCYKKKKNNNNNNNKKQEKKSASFSKVNSYQSRKYLTQFSWNLECEVMTLAGISTAKISWFRWSVTELHIREN